MSQHTVTESDSRRWSMYYSCVVNEMQYCNDSDTEGKSAKTQCCTKQDGAVQSSDYEHTVVLKRY